MQKPKRARSPKIQAAPKRKRSRLRKMEPLPFLAFTIIEFCKVNGFSPAMYWKLKNQGLGPVEMKIGRRILISTEAASNWQRQREVNTAL